MNFGGKSQLNKNSTLKVNMHPFSDSKFRSRQMKMRPRQGLQTYLADINVKYFCVGKKYLRLFLKTWASSEMKFEIQLLNVHWLLGVALFWYGLSDNLRETKAEAAAAVLCCFFSWRQRVANLQTLEIEGTYLEAQAARFLLFIKGKTHFLATTTQLR